MSSRPPPRRFFSNRSRDARCFPQQTGGIRTSARRRSIRTPRSTYPWIGGATRQLHPDFGPPPYGIPYVAVAGDQARVPVTFDYDDESDTGISGLAGYPVPEEAKTQPHYIEGDVPGGGSSGDRHLLIIDRDRWLLYELFATTWNASAGPVSYTHLTLPTNREV